MIPSYRSSVNMLSRNNSVFTIWIIVKSVNAFALLHRRYNTLLPIPFAIRISVRILKYDSQHLLVLPTVTVNLSHIKLSHVSHLHSDWCLNCIMTLLVYCIDDCVTVKLNIVYNLSEDISILKRKRRQISLPPFHVLNWKETNI